MKKIFALFLSLSILCCCASAYGVYTLPNGAQWGMKQEQITAIEGREADQSGEGADHFYNMSYWGKKISKYTATCSYSFKDDSLVLAMY